jgi:hypothetical protein
MSQTVVQFTFDRSVSMDEVDGTLRLALLAVESLHGEDRVRLEAKFILERAKRSCSVDASSDVGRTLALIFGGYLRREFGNDAVKMRRSGDALRLALEEAVGT